MPDLRIGVSGWTYKAWAGGFYPDDLPQRRRLEYLSRRMNTLEINGSFYRLQTPATYRRWHDETPPDFVFAVKGSRYITHMKKLKEPEAPVANFFASGVLRLGPKLGPILWQLPGNLHFDADRTAPFLDLLPGTHREAAAIARRHDHRLKGRSWTRPEHDGPVRHAVEVRHDSYLVPEFIELLRGHGCALVFADSPDWPYAEDVTADFVYLRLHGAEQLYASRYTDRQLAWWADRIRAWAAGREPRDARPRDVYAYFDNDSLGHAPFDALRLADRMLGGKGRRAAD